MSEFSISSPDFEEGGEIPKNFGYKHGNEEPSIVLLNIPSDVFTLAIIMDDPDAMGAVGKVWVHYLMYFFYTPSQETGDEINPFAEAIEGLNDFGEIGYGGPAPPDKRHTYIFKAYALDTELDLNPGYSKQELEDAMKGHIIAEAKLTGTYAP